MTFIDSYSYYIKVKLLSGSKYSIGQFTKYIKLKEIYYEFTNFDTS